MKKSKLPVSITTKMMKKQGKQWSKAANDRTNNTRCCIGCYKSCGARGFERKGFLIERSRDGEGLSRSQTEAVRILLHKTSTFRHAQLCSYQEMDGVKVTTRPLAV